MTNTAITFELFGATYTRKANGYCFARCNGETAKTRRVGKAEFEARYAEYQMMNMTIDEIEEAVTKVEEEITTEEVEAVAAEMAPKTNKSSRSKKNTAFRVDVDGVEIALTAKQADFIKHLPDTYFWENGLDSCIWVDCLCDDIGGQFEGKPMTVGAMISTICEKGLGSRGTDRRDGRKATCFALTDTGKVVAKALGLK